MRNSYHNSAPDFAALNPGYACFIVMAGLVPAIHVFAGDQRRGCPAQGRAWTAARTESDEKTQAALSQIRAVKSKLPPQMKFRR